MLIQGISLCNSKWPMPRACILRAFEWINDGVKAILPACVGK